MHTEKLCSQTDGVFCSDVWVEEGFQLSATREEHVQTHEDLSVAYPGSSKAMGYSLIGCHQLIKVIKSLQVPRKCKKMLSTWFWWSGWNHHEMWSLEILSNADKSRMHHCLEQKTVPAKRRRFQRLKQRNTQNRTTCHKAAASSAPRQTLSDRKTRRLQIKTQMTESDTIRI